ncbi:hypothetical protein ACPV5R_18735 [Vibrio astriarenae]
MAFKRLLKSALITFSILLPATAVGDTPFDYNCDQFFEDDSTINSRAICDRDLLGTSISLIFSDAYDKSPAIRTAYEMSSLPPPLVTLGRRPVVDEIGLASSIVTNVSAAMNSIFWLVALPFFGIGLISRINWLIKEEDVIAAIKSPEAVGSGLYFSFIFYLMVSGNSLVNYGQALIIMAAGFALGLANQMLSSVLVTLGLEVESNNGDVFSYDKNAVEGHTYASGLVSATQVVNDSVRFLSHAVQPDWSAQHMLLKSDFYDTNYIERVSQSREKKHLTIAEAAMHALTTNSVKLTQGNPFISTQRVIYQNGESKVVESDPRVRTSVGHQYDLTSGRASKGQRVRAHVAEDRLPIDYIFDDTNLYTSSMLFPEIGYSTARELAQNPIFSELSSYILTENHDELTDVESEANEEFVELLNDLADIINASVGEDQRPSALALVPHVLLGTISGEHVGSSSKNVITTHINPREADVFVGGGISPMQDFLIKNAFDANNNITAAACAEGLLGDNSDRIMRELWMSKELADNPNKLMREQNLKSSGATFQCFVINDSNEVESLLTPLFPSNHSIFEVDGDQLVDQQRIIIKEMREETEAFVISQRQLARERLDTIARIYAISVAAGQHVAITATVSETPDSVRSVLTDIRRKGVGSLHSYFFTLNSLATKFRESYNAVDMTMGHVLDVDYDLSVNKLAESGIFGALKEFFTVGIDVGAADERLEVASTAHIHTSPMIQAITNGSASDLVHFHSGVDNIPVDALLAKKLENFTEYMLVPTDVLKKGMGFANGDTMAKGFKDCSMLSNCINIVGHPLATLQMFGEDMFIKSLKVIIMHQLLSLMKHQLDDTLSGDGEILGEIRSTVLKGVPIVSQLLVGVSFALKILVSITSVFSMFAHLLLTAGVALAYMLPILPLITGIVLWLGWMAEILLLFICFPIFAFLSMVRVEGRSLMPFKNLISMIASIVIKPMLNVVSFLGFFSLTYVMVYITNTLAFFLFRMMGGGIGIIDVLSNQLALIIIIFIWYKLVFKVNNEMAELPSYVLGFMGVKSFNAVATSGIEQMLAGKAIASAIEGGLSDAMSSGGSTTTTSTSSESKGDQQGAGDSSGVSGSDNRMESNAEYKNAPKVEF